MHQAVEDGIGQRRISQSLMPVLDRQLTAHQCGPAIMAVFDNLQQVEEFLIDDEIERNLLQALARGQRFGISDLAMSLGVRATQVRAGLDNLRLQGMVEQGMKDRWTITLAGNDAIAG